MKLAIISFLIAMLAGVAAGGSLAYRQYAVPKNEFGPFTPERVVTSDELDSYVASLRPEGVAKIEVVGGNEFDFGVMRRNAEATHQFVIKNVGGGPLDLNVTGSTCKCTVGSLQKTSLAPGESTVVDMSWTAQTSSRAFSQSAMLKTSDPAAGEISLVIRGDVVDLLAAEPSSWDLGDFAAAVPIQLETSLFNYSDEPIEIVDVQWMDENFDALSTADVQRRDVDPEREQIHRQASEAFEVSVDVAPGTPQGRLNQALRVEYRTVGDTENHPPLELRLTGRVVGAISVLGGARLTTDLDGNHRLKLGVVEPGEVEQEKVHVLLRGPLKDVATLRIGEVEPADALEAELGDAADRGSMRVLPLVVRTKADAPEIVRDGSRDGKTGIVTIESDHPEVAPVRVRVVFRIGKSFGGE